MDNEANRSEALQKERLKILLVRCGKKLSDNAESRQTQGRILRILYLHGAMTQRAMQDKLSIQSGSMSEIAAKLEKKGLIRREKGQTDKRQIYLALTDAGRVNVELFRERPSFPHPCDFDVLTEPERETLCGMLEKLLSSWGA